MTDPPQLPTGTFEAHLTVPLAIAGDASSWAGSFEGVCGELGLEPLLIEAPGAAAPLQPMASCFLHGTLAEAKARVAGLARQLDTRGYPVARVKLEAVGRASPYLPERAADLVWGPARYFEFHLKIHLPSPAEAERLERFCSQGEGHVSRNPRRTFAGGATQRFVTLRLRELGKREAAARHTQLCHSLTEAGFQVTPGTIEFALLDTAVELDAGWAS